MGSGTIVASTPGHGVRLRGLIGAGTGAQVSGSLKEGFGQTVRLDVLPHIDVGARIASVRLSGGGMLLLPAAAAPKTETKARVMFGLGVSGEF